MGWRSNSVAAGVLLAAFLFQTSPAQAARKTQTAAADVWAATWEASPEPARPPLVALGNQTVRQLARISFGGIYIRVRLSNEFGDQPLFVGAGHLALATGVGAAIQPGTDRALSFGGKPSITIPPGARVLSDPVSLTVPALSEVAVSLYFPNVEGAVTEHNFATRTSYLTPGDATAAPDLTGAATITKRVILTGIDVSAGSGTKTVVALGDSLAVGFGSTMDANHRWPDRFAERLQGPKGMPGLVVVNAGIGGNRLLHDFFGPNALSRFDRDVLSQPNVAYLIVLLGINDIGFPGGRKELAGETVTADDIIAGYRQLVVRANSYGIKVFFGTLPPFAGFNERPGFYSDEAEAKRQAVNQWIRINREAQGYIDFDAALRDPKAPIRLLPAYDSGDHLDPNDAGYQAMADAIPLRLFQ